MRRGVWRQAPPRASASSPGWQWWEADGPPGQSVACAATNADTARCPATAVHASWGNQVPGTCSIETGTLRQAGASGLCSRWHGPALKSRPTLVTLLDATASAPPPARAAAAAGPAELPLACGTPRISWRARCVGGPPTCVIASDLVTSAAAAAALELWSKGAGQRYGVVSHSRSRRQCAQQMLTTDKQQSVGTCGRRNRVWVDSRRAKDKATVVFPHMMCRQWRTARGWAGVLQEERTRCQA